MTPEEVHIGGVVFRVASDLYFLPASIAMKVMPVPEMARVPGAPRELRGVALVDGDMIPVVQLGAPSPSHIGSSSAASAMLVCLLVGERLGLVGIEVVATGRFETAENSAQAGDLGPSVKHGTEIARSFDVAAVIAKVREGRWAV